MCTTCEVSSTRCEPAANPAAHSLTPLLTEADPPAFPFLCLLVSGGHTLVVLVQSHARFQVLATTLDDSIGYVASRPSLLTA